MTTYNYFNTALLAWFKLHGRKDLPWQTPREPYRVWVSEIMLQQTQVQTVIAYFNRFILRFPTIADLAKASDDEVLSLWSGLGYYSRARNLQQTAKIIDECYQGQFPRDLELLIALPGIGPSTAAAILSQAFNLPAPILDGNVKRVLARFFQIEGWPEQAQVKRILWEHARLCMPLENCADYTQAIMDLGATCCTSKKPDCANCPLQEQCLAFKNKVQLLYPEKKIKKTVPLRSQQFLVLTNKQGLIFLEKRPPTGIWGGLWCLPALNLNECPIHFIEKNYGLSGDNPEPIVELSHKFSHFHLKISALGIKTRSINKQLGEPRGRWFAMEELGTVGIAKPTCLILNHSD